MDTNRTQGVQIDITETATGVSITDPSLAILIIQDLAGDPGWDAELELVDGGWLATVPADWYAEASEEGGFLLTHSGGYVFEIPMY